MMTEWLKAICFILSLVILVVAISAIVVQIMGDSNLPT